MTTATALPAPLERYLRRATAGLPPAKRQEVWDELEEHVYARAEQLQWQGASPTQALSRALAELGPPLRVSAALNGVHNMPKMIAFGGAAALVLSAAFYALAQNQSVLNVPVLTERPVLPVCSKTVPTAGIRILERKGEQTCYVLNDPAFYQGAYLSLNKLRDAVQAQGGKVEILNDGRWRFSFPNTAEKTSVTTKALFTEAGEPYANANVFMHVLLALKVPFMLKSFEAPQIVLSGLTIKLTGQGSGASDQLYGAFGMPLIDNLLEETNALLSGVSYGPTPGQNQHTIQTGLPAGEVVMLITAETPNNEPVEYIGTPADATPPTSEPDGASYAFSIAEVQAGGMATFRASAAQLNFTADIRGLSPQGGGRKSALLVRVTNTPLNNLKSGIFVPAESTSDTR